MLRSQWEKSISVAGVQVIRWFIKPDEWRMIDAFFETESSEHGDLQDIFFRMESSFENQQSYNTRLLEEWKEKFNNSGETISSLSEAGIEINYHPGEDKSISFFTEIQKLASSIPDFERNIVIYISPASIFEKRSFVQWIEVAVQNRLPAQVKIMLVDDSDNKVYTSLSDNYPSQVKTLSPNLQMDKVMRQMATSGNPAAPDVQFRKCVFEMADAVARKDDAELEKLGRKAVSIATKAGWKHLIATAYMVTGGYLLSLKRYTRSEHYYNEAISSCKTSYAEGDVACGVLLTQCYALKGAAEQLQGEKIKATQSYVQMAEQAEQQNDWLNAMEGWRLAANTAEKNGKPKESFGYYSNAMEKGKKLDERARTSSAFLLVGEGILETALQSGNAHRIAEIKEQMVTLAGSGWEEQLQKMKQSTN